MEIKIINTKTISDSEYEAYRANTSDGTRQRADRMRLEQDKKSTIVGEGAAKLMLAKKLHTSPAAIVFHKQTNGKPFTDSCFFNISHSNGTVAVAVNETEIGIDIEKIRDFDERIIDRVCTENEKQFILSAETAETKNERFFIIWTLKEAYFKCIGTGITADLKSVAFTIKDGEVTLNQEHFTAVVSADYKGYILSVVYFISA